MLGADGGSHPGSVVLNALIDLIGGLLTKVANTGKEHLGVSGDAGAPKPVDELGKVGFDEQKASEALQVEKAKVEARLKSESEHNTVKEIQADQKAMDAGLDQGKAPEKPSLVDKVTSSVKSAFKW